jgi:hypothetical protein
MSDEHLITELAVRAMRWRLAPGRYLKTDRGWTPRSAFRPLTDLNDAFRALEAVTRDYSLISIPGGGFRVRLLLAGRTANATDDSKARAICLALAAALGTEATGQQDGSLGSADQCAG